MKKQKKRKEFSVLKWLVFPLNSLVLSGVIAYFNLKVFGFEDGLPYSVVVALICAFSIVINKYTESENRSLARAAFVFEIFLTAALVINAAYSISVQRKMSVARMGEQSQAQTIEQIGKLRGSRTQREALKTIEKKESAQSVFADVERVLFWIMIAELALYGLSAFTLFALAKLIERDEEAKTKTPADDDFPADLDVIERRSNYAPKMTTLNDRIDDTRNQQKTTQAGLRKLREALKLIAFSNPPGHFKADIRDDYVNIRLMESKRGDESTKHSTKAALSILDDAVKMEPGAFRERLKQFLSKRGFPLNSATS